MHMTKCITIHVLLGNIRPRFRYHKMQILWTFTPQVAGGACSAPSTQMYCAMTDGHSMLCLDIIRVPDQETKSMIEERGAHYSACLPSNFTLTTPLRGGGGYSFLQMLIFYLQIVWCNYFFFSLQSRISFFTQTRRMGYFLCGKMFQS